MPSEGEERNGEASRAPRSGLRMMVIIVAGVALVAIYANVQRVRQDKIEKVIVTPVSTATPSAR
jgi:hypothetical protein